jgi:hypothetical protein
MSNNSACQKVIVPFHFRSDGSRVSGNFTHLLSLRTEVVDHSDDLEM